MKKRNIIILSLLMFTAFVAGAQTIKVCEVNASATDEMEIKIETGSGIGSYIATGFYLELPEGFSVVGAEGVKADNVQSNHIVRIGAIGDNKLRVAIYSLSNSQLSVSGSSSQLPLCTVKLKAPNLDGTYTGRLTGVELVGVSHNLVKNDAQTFNIQIQPVLRGDANKDKKVTITDAVAVVNYILGNASEGFSVAAADVNHDGKITITDAVGIVNIILNGSTASAPALDAPEAVETEEWTEPE